jgi:hypothetical protein
MMLTDPIFVPAAAPHKVLARIILLYLIGVCGRVE